MHISLTPQLEKIIKDKVASGLYNNASEVIRDALRRMDCYDELFQEIQTEKLRKLLNEGLRQADAGQLREYSMETILKQAK